MPRWKPCTGARTARPIRWKPACRFVTLDRKYVVAIVRDITERKQAQIEMENIHKQLVESSRLAGMAEIATNVLHNVGNVLNSVNISTDLIVDERQEVQGLQSRQSCGFAPGTRARPWGVYDP